MKSLLLLMFLGLGAGAHAQCVTPTFTSLSPGSGPVAGGATFQIAGANFCLGVIVDFGTMTATLTSVTATLIRGTVPAGVPGIVALNITNPGTSTVRINNAFTYLNAPAGLTCSAGTPKFAATGQSVSFFGYVAGGTPPYTYWWDFQDGGTANTITGTHTFVAAGRYEVVFFVRDRAGATAMSTTNAYITAPVTNFLTDGQGHCLTDNLGNCLTAN